MDYMREVERSLPVLEWDAAVMALTRNGMDVDKTCLAIQAERLNPVYEYIFGEYTGVAKTEMEKVKGIISNPDEELYPLEVCMYLHKTSRINMTTPSLVKLHWHHDYSGTPLIRTPEMWPPLYYYTVEPL